MTRSYTPHLEQLCQAYVPHLAVDAETADTQQSEH